MISYESIKRLGIDHLGIDAESSFETFDPSTSNHTIFIHLLKLDEIVCPLCGSYNDYTNKGSKSQIIKYSSLVEDNINIKLYRQFFKCNWCNHTFKEVNPFIENKRHISIFKDYKILEALKDITATYTSVAIRFNVSVTYVIETFDKKVDIKLQELPEVICVDEIYAKKLTRQKFCFIIYDPINHKLIDVLDSRRLNNLDTFFFNISSNQREKVKFFSIDLYDTYRTIGYRCFLNAIVCADSFHVIKNLSLFFQELRIRIMKKYSYLKDQNDPYYWYFKKYFKN